MNYKEYLKAHSLNEKLVTELFQWSFDENKITIPVFNIQGNLEYKRYRHLNPTEAKFTSDQGSHPTIYPAFLLKDQQDIVICEGEPDCVRLWQENIPAFTGTSGVSKFDDALASYFVNRNIFICLDTDEAGKKAITKYNQSFQNVGVSMKIIELPKEFKDISEFFTSGKIKSDFSTLKDEALTYKQWIIKTNEALHPIIGGKQFEETEYPHKKWLVDKVIRAEGITLWTGEGGVGKTTLSYTVAKAVAEGSSWLNTFPTTKGKVLILDKENDPIDVQTSLRGVGIIGHPDILYYTTSETFNFLDTNSGELTDEAIYLKMYCEENQISAVIIDSLVDFYIGDENSANYASMNMNGWKQVFHNMAIITIHHENKQMPNIKKSASTRSRGSSHLFNGAQGMLSFSVLDETTPDKIKVEHAKVRGARKLKPFEVDMIIKNDPEQIGETIITGFKYQGEIQEEILLSQKTKQAILEFLGMNLNRDFDANELIENLPNINRRNIDGVLPDLRASNQIGWKKDGKKYVYFAKNIEEIAENFIKNNE